jgi:hypothetical protein
MFSHAEEPSAEFEAMIDRWLTEYFQTLHGSCCQPCQLVDDLCGGIDSAWEWSPFHWSLCRLLDRGEVRRWNRTGGAFRGHHYALTSMAHLHHGKLESVNAEELCVCGTFCTTHISLQGLSDASKSELMRRASGLIGSWVSFNHVNADISVASPHHPHPPLLV